MTNAEAKASLAAYVSECQRLYRSDRYGWSVSCQDRAEDAWAAQREPWDVVAEMNAAYAYARANRNA